MKQISTLVAFLIITTCLRAQTSSCTGTPYAGIPVASTFMACGSSDTLTVNDSSAYGSGIAYQWQSSTDGTAWTNLPGATTVAYSLTVAGAYYYRCTVTCTTSSSTASSTAVNVGYETSCPCRPAYNSAGCSYVMVSIYLIGYGGSYIKEYAGCDGFGYRDRTGIVAPISLQQGGAYNGTAYLYSGYWFNEGQAWIDFNSDGIFSASEAVSNVFGMPSIYLDSLSFTINIPDSAQTGIRRLRVRQVSTLENTTLSSAMDPCNYEDYDSLDVYQEGNAFDYAVLIVSGLGSTTSVHEVNKESIQIYPNPTNDVLTIKIDNTPYTSFTISNTMGEVALQQQINNTQINVNVKSLAAGVYYVMLKGESGVTVRKFVKE